MVPVTPAGGGRVKSVPDTANPAWEGRAISALDTDNPAVVGRVRSLLETVTPVLDAVTTAGEGWVKSVLDTAVLLGCAASTEKNELLAFFKNPGLTKSVQPGVTGA